MKNLQITKPALIHGKTVPAGTHLENVDNSLAAALVVSGHAVEIPARPAVLAAAPPPAAAAKAPAVEPPPAVA